MATDTEALKQIIDDKRKTTPQETENPLRCRVETFLARFRDETLSPVEATYLDDNVRGHACRELAEQLGARYACCTLDNFLISPDEVGARSLEALGRIRYFADKMEKCLTAGGGVTLYGKPGTGKDHLLAALMFRAIIDYGYSVEWVNGLDLYAEMRRKIRDDESEDALIRRYQKPLILAISDPLPPKGDTSEYQAATLYRIIDRRYRDMKSTWATMNVEGGEEANERIAANIVDRLRHNSLCIHCDWDSYRKAAADCSS